MVQHIRKGKGSEKKLRFLFCYLVVLTINVHQDQRNISSLPV